MILYCISLYNVISQFSNFASHVPPPSLLVLAGGYGAAAAMQGYSYGGAAMAGYAGAYNMASGYGAAGGGGVDVAQGPGATTRVGQVREVGVINILSRTYTNCLSPHMIMDVTRIEDILVNSD